MMLRGTQLIIVFIFCSCAATKKINISTSSRLKFYGQYEIPHNESFNQTTIGGLSGIDYDPQKDVFYLVSDDPSRYNPARFYTARIKWGTNGIVSFDMIAVDTLKQVNGQSYPSSKENKDLASDPEAIRFDVLRQQMAWTSEGERIITGNEIILQDPAIHISDMNGKEISKYYIPSNLKASKERSGGRHNSSFEGFSFADNFKHAYVSMEVPLLQDGPLAATGDSSAMVRIIKYDAATGMPLKQYAYRIDPVAVAPNPPGSFKINGITDILWVDNDQLLVVERSFSTGRQDCVVKLFLTDLSTGRDVTAINSLASEPVIPVRKELLLNSTSLGIFIDNIEGICFGPKLPNGKPSLVAIADNNFSPNQKSQVLVFEID